MWFKENSNHYIFLSTSYDYFGFFNTFGMKKSEISEKVRQDIYSPGDTTIVSHCHVTHCTNQMSRYIEISYWGIIIRHVFHVGEISAGKSSLLNFLIGRDVLPTSVRESRSVTCRLRYGTEKTAKLIDDSGNEIDDLKYDESNEALKRLKALIKGDEAVLGLSYIDIFLDKVSLQVNYTFNWT